MNINKHIIIIAKYKSTKSQSFILYIFFLCKNRGCLKIRYWYKHIEKYLYVVNTVMQVWLWILTSQIQDFKSCVQCVHSEKQNIVAQKINQEQKPTWKNNQKPDMPSKIFFLQNLYIKLDMKNEVKYKYIKKIWNMTDETTEKYPDVCFFCW